MSTPSTEPDGPVATAAADTLADPDSATEADQPDATAELGDAGKKALDRMKAENQRLREELATSRAAAGDKRGVESIRSKAKAEVAEEVAELRAKLEGREAEYEAEKKAREVERAALGKANDRILRSEIRAAATGKLANPAIALKLLDLSSFEVGDDGDVDAEAINAALDDLVQKEPYLGVAQGDAKRFKGTADGGPKGTAGKPQLSDQDVDRLMREGKHDEVEKARTEGRLNDLLGIK